MAKAACKCKQAECEECPEWIFTFADLVMLMMGFFVILWVLKPAPGKGDTPEANQDWLEVVAKIREAFDYLPDPKSNDPVDKLIILRKLQEMKPLKGPGLGGETTLPRHGAEGTEPEVTSVRPGTQAIIGTRVLFDAGSVSLSPLAQATLAQIVTQIKGVRNVVIVKGHTSLDDVPENTDPQQKLELSLRRARAVADYLVAHGVQPDVLRVQGCSTYEPVAQRAYTPEMRQLNRRVEVVDSRILIVELQDPPAPARPAERPSIPTTAPASAISIAH